MPSTAANSSVAQSTPGGEAAGEAGAVEAEAEDDEGGDREERHRRQRLQGAQLGAQVLGEDRREGGAGGGHATAAALADPEPQHLVGLGQVALGVVGDDDAGAAGAGADQRRGPARAPRRRGWSRARRAAAAPARAGRSGRSPAAGASRPRARRPARRRAAPSRRRAAAPRSAPRPASPRDPVQAGVEAQVLAAAEVAVEQRLVAEVADPPAQLPGLAAAARSRARATSPPLGRSRVARIRSSVVLPAPLGPSTTSDSPARELRPTPSSAGRSP